MALFHHGSSARCPWPRSAMLTRQWLPLRVPLRLDCGGRSVHGIEAGSCTVESPTTSCQLPHLLFGLELRAWVLPGVSWGPRQVVQPRPETQKRLLRGSDLRRGRDVTRRKEPEGKTVLSGGNSGINDEEAPKWRC